MRRALLLLAAFVRRDWLNESSYRAMFLFESLSVVGSIIVFYAIGELVEGKPDALAPYGGQYFPFALVGVAVSSYFTTSLASFSMRLRQAQTAGALEAMLTTPVPGGVVLLLSGVWDYLIATFRLVVYLIVGLLLFNLRFNINPAAAIPLALCSLVAFGATGLIVASVILVIKRGESITNAIALVASLFGGMLFPVALLPDSIEPLHYVVPLYYSLDGLRRALLTGAGPSDVAGSMAGIAIAAAILVVAAAFAIRWALCQTRAEASLGQY